jgi:hypothetical protein
MKNPKKMMYLFLTLTLFSFSSIYGQKASKQEPSCTNTPTPALAEGVLYTGPKLNEEAFQIQLGVDYILWVISQEGLDVAINNLSAVPSATVAYEASPGVGTSYSPKFRPRNGFKVHADVVLADYEDVDLFLEYIWLDRSAPNFSATTNPELTYPQLSIGPIVRPGAGTTSELNSLSTNYKFEYNVLDFEIGRLSSIARNIFSARPFWGIRGTWQTANWNTSYVGTGYDEDYITAQTRSFVNIEQKTSGAGVRGGLDLGFNLTPKNNFVQNLILTGSFSMSGIYSSSSISLTSGEVLPTRVTQVYQNTQQKIYRIVPVLDLSVGLGWNYTFGGDSKDRYNVEIHAAWDTQSWINFGQFTLNSLYNSGSQNMTVQGLTVGGSFFF